MDHHTSTHDQGVMPGHAPQLELLPINEHGIAPMATHVAVQDGDWFDPQTWSSGTVPGAGALVQIPADHTVHYQGSDPAPLFIVRVDGTLDISAPDGAQTAMTVDTMITAPGSVLNVKADAPGSGTVDIVFAEGTPAAHAGHFTDVSQGDGVIGRYDWDPKQLSLGLVASGEVNVTGQTVTSQMQLAHGAAAGSDTLVFDAGADAGTWAVGQKIVVGATHLAERAADGSFQSQDEIRTISDVYSQNGQLVVVLDQPLVYDHVGPDDPRTGQELTGYVGNLSRNVTFSSAVADKNGDGIADEGLSLGETKGADDHYVSERGHIMFMHNDDVTVMNGAFFGLGRTDKSLPVDDYVTDGSDYNHRLFTGTGRDGDYDPATEMEILTDPAEITNMRGRYSLHLHQAGTGDAAGISGDLGGIEALNAASDLPPTSSGGALIMGNAVWGAPGWGIVQHSSVADVCDNVVYGAQGSAFVAESGDEIGRWMRNAAFSSTGDRPYVKVGDSGDFNADGGFEGVGFYLRGRMISVADNVAISSERAGFFYHNLGLDTQENRTDALGQLANIAPGAETVPLEDVPIRFFDDNTVIAASEGIRIVTDPLDTMRKFNDAYSVMLDFTAYEIDLAGVSLTYSSKYIFDNFLILGTENKQASGATAGFFFRSSAADMTVSNSYVSDFRNVAINWAEITDRQEYRRGFWDPAFTTDSDAAPVYQGMGTAHGIENPIYNLWNINYVDVSYGDIEGLAKFSMPKVTVDMGDGTTANLIGRTVFSTDPGAANAPNPDAPLEISLLDDSANGALVALWREDLANAPDQTAVLANHIPLAYQDSVYLSKIHFVDGSRVKRESYLEYVDGINADIWSGTVLEFAKTDSLGRLVFAYDDFSPMDPAGASRAVTTNERIVFSREMIDGVLHRDGYFTLPGNNAMKFVKMPMLFGDRLSGELTLKTFLVALDMAWHIPPSVRYSGPVTAQEGLIIAPEYAWFENGVLRADLAPVEGSLAEVFPEEFADYEIIHGDDLGNRLKASHEGSILLGYGGEDSLIGRNEADWLDGGDGDDALVGKGGNDVLFGGDGADMLNGGDGDDQLNGDNGDDQLFGGAGNDIIHGGAGDDRAKGDAGDDQLFGEAGNDTLVGGDGVDLLDGGDGDDTLVGENGNDTLYGGAGNDRLFAGEGNDIIHAGADDDLAKGDAGDDQIFGEAGNDTLMGGDGMDLLDGGDGADILVGENGNDTLYGGAGNDRLFAGEGNDIIHAGAGDDQAKGDAGDDRIYGEDGDDYLQGGDGMDYIDGGEGADTISGDDGDDTIFGGAGADTIYAGLGNDIIDGGDGDDSLNGADGDDRLNGGLGDDHLWGGSGIDTFYFDPNWGMDTIHDFSTQDDFLAFSIAGLGFDDLIISHQDHNTVIEYAGAGAGMITLVGVSAAALAEENFIFT